MKVPRRRWPEVPVVVGHASSHSSWLASRLSHPVFLKLFEYIAEVTMN